MGYSAKLNARLLEQAARSYLDAREDRSPGWNFNESELKGIPIRLDVGSKEVASKTVVISGRDDGSKETFALDEIPNKVTILLTEIQDSLLRKARAFRDSNTFDQKVTVRRSKILASNSGFVKAFLEWNKSKTSVNQKRFRQVSDACARMDREKKENVPLRV
ncbi:MAG TPA: His/Gly/Thr/Pro-type tRNA ligase C-terminal domain-containing protein [Pyrinomonadaceae bacterium]|nr:His/Gly/Thr/Pro-type tRNA ligase C-terminal domain-containing protein [Pyrinomonadaceae bacterium]